MINKFNPNKLLLSKWTAVEPKKKERHFIVTKLVHDDDGKITGCILEAVINNNSYSIDWQELKNSENWLIGWK